MVHHEDDSPANPSEGEASLRVPGQVASAPRGAAGPGDEEESWAKAFFREEKVRVAERALHLATALRQGADALAAEGEMGAEATRRGAEALETWSSQLRARDIEELKHDVASWAERHPLTLCAGCAVAAFALTRVLRSGPARALPPEPDAHLGS